MIYQEIQEKIKKIAKSKNAVILAHNYQRPEIQDIADFVGDSLHLSRCASKTDADIILFCGVSFMAETAKILAPSKKVLLPRYEAGCPMAMMITKSELQKLKDNHPDAVVVAYVNTTAEIKAMADVCCTSSNALKVVKGIKERKIIFVPDKNLADYCKRRTPEKEFIIYDGYCYVHNQITYKQLKNTKDKYPAARVLAHPECPFEALQLADEILSTEKMVEYVEKSEYNEFIIATEPGIIHRLKKNAPSKK
ncbi:MAG TPA: quinolinate synthase NadA, partial [bacterium]|nr:quinolinate synthase NadA [bacterium]